MPERPRIQVLLDAAELSAEARGALEHIAAEVTIHNFAARHTLATAAPYHARLILTTDARTVTNGKLATLLKWFDSAPCPTLVLSEDPTLVEHGADAMAPSGRAIHFATRLSQDELVGRLHTMCALHRPMEGLRSEVTELRQADGRLRADLGRLRDEIRLAGVLQRDLLRSSLPIVSGVNINAVSQPVESLSGDFYDISRLDDHHIAFFLADATGHGVSAALLAAFVRRWVHQAGTGRGAGHPPAPDEVLADLNRDLLDAQLHDCQFVASLFALYDERTRIIRWARGGTPYPILVRRRESPRQVHSDGPLVGVSRDARFQLVELHLAPGDTLIFHSDGLDALLAGETSGLGCCDLHRTDWFRTLGWRPITEHLEEVHTRLASRPPTDSHADDTTIITLDVQEQPTRISPSRHGRRLTTQATPVAVAV